jgi:hypothetical protein
VKEIISQLRVKTVEELERSCQELHQWLPAVKVDVQKEMKKK